jgi:F-type H+-transporting ATPase subunit epsilon
MDPRVKPAGDSEKELKAMANTFHFDLVSPEKIAFSGEVEQVDVPGVEGDFGVLAGHAPFVASIRPGILNVTVNGKHEKVIVLGGLAEVSSKGLTILADTVTSLGELDRVGFARQIEEMEEALKDEEPGNELDRAITRLDHFKAIQTYVTSTGMH